MIRQKRGFLTFIFSLLPGAGEMYMGFFKQGASIMLGFFGIFAISSILELGPVIILLPVIWFYSFFHVHNLASMPSDAFMNVQDHIIFTEDDEQVKKVMQSAKARKIFAIVLIVLGVASLWDSIVYILYAALPDGANFFVDNVANFVPQCLIALMIIYLGVVLIKGKKQELDETPDEAAASQASAYVPILETTEETVKTEEKGNENENA